VNFRQTRRILCQEVEIFYFIFSLARSVLVFFSLKRRVAFVYRSGQTEREPEIVSNGQLRRDAATSIVRSVLTNFSMPNVTRSVRVPVIANHDNGSGGSNA
jgi:hypothetical protein